MKTPILILLVTTTFLIITSLVIGFIAFTAYVYDSAEEIEAICPKNDCEVIYLPKGMQGIAMSQIYDIEPKSEYEKLVDYCNELYPLPCNYLD